jgi:predicted nucleic acid-binding protein
VTVFVDTSALVALIDGGDEHHAASVDELTALRGERHASLRTHEYVVVEAISLLQRRVGMPAVRLLIDAFLPAIDVRWIDRDTHVAAREALVAADRRRVSFVDQVSFEVMRAEGIVRAFAFDRDFADEGFAVIPR